MVEVDQIYVVSKASMFCRCIQLLLLKRYRQENAFVLPRQFSESSDESSLATSPQRHYLPQSMKIVHEIMYKVEVLYVLCVLLMGRQRTQVRTAESNQCVG